MFLVDNAAATNDWDGVVEHVRGILTKYDSEVKDALKWDERKLAYKIDDHVRGTYVLSRFDAPAVSIAKIRNDCQLSDTIIRALFVRDEKPDSQPPIPNAVNDEAVVEDTSEEGAAPEEVAKDSELVLAGQADSDSVEGEAGREIEG